MPNIGYEKPIYNTDPTDNTGNRAIFITHTDYMFSWDECETLYLDKDNSIPADTLTLEEALELIEQGYTAIPY